MCLVKMRILAKFLYIFNGITCRSTSTKFWSTDVHRIGTMEAEKLGFSRIIIPENNLKGFDLSKHKIEVLQVKKVEEAFRRLFG